MTDVAIVGGGLAGMVSALRLAERGCQITIYEGSDRLGGKAGSNQVDGCYEDHGFHIFPAWYQNVWKIIDELNLRANFSPLRLFHQLRLGEFPHYRTLDNIASARTFFKNLTSGVMPIPDMFLFYYTALDLLSRPLKYSDFLDEISVTGFVYSRWYRNKQATFELQDLLLKAASTPSYAFSAMTLQKMLNSWMQYPDPMYSIARGSLQEKFILPIQEKLTMLGVKIYLNYKLDQIDVAGQRVTTLHFINMLTNQPITHPVDHAILALQPIDLIPLLDDSIFRVAPAIFDVKMLQAFPMAALSLYFDRKLANIPPEHVGLDNSQHQLSFIDISQTWSGLTNTVLDVVASDFITLANLPDAEVTETIITELMGYFPEIKREMITKTYLQPHVLQPLFINLVGSWLFRPDPSKPTQLTNAFLAGDYCQTYVDLATLEGATEAGLRAAEALRQAVKLPDPIPVQPVKAPPRWILVIGRIVLLPAAAVAKLWTLLIRAN